MRVVTLTVLGIASIVSTRTAMAQAPRRSPTPTAKQPVMATPAEKDWWFGPEVNFATNSVGPGVGVRADYAGLGRAVKAPGLAAYASFDYFFPGNSVKWWEINANATYDIPHVTGFRPYAGAGLNYIHTSVSVPGFGSASGSSTGLNLLGGVHFKPAPKLNGFGEVRFELHSGSAIVFTAGLLF